MSLSDVRKVSTLTFGYERVLQKLVEVSLVLQGSLDRNLDTLTNNGL